MLSASPNRAPRSSMSSRRKPAAAIWAGKGGGALQRFWRPSAMVPDPVQQRMRRVAGDGLRHRHGPGLRNPAFPAGHCVGILRSYCSFHRSRRMPETAAIPIARRPYSRHAARRGRRSFAAYYRWVDDALRHRADGYRLLDSALVGLPGVRRLARQRFRRSAFADVHAARALRQQATERASAVLTPRQVLAL